MTDDIYSEPGPYPTRWAYADQETPMSLPTVCSNCRVRPVGPGRSVCEVCYPPELPDPIRPHPSHTWAEDKPQTKCVACGAYKHLGSGFRECKPYTPEPSPTWALVELMGHVRYGGRLTEEEKFGCKLGRVDVPQADGTFRTVYFGGASVYRIQLVTEAVARHVGRESPQPVSPWDFPKPALAAAKACINCIAVAEPTCDAGRCATHCDERCDTHCRRSMRSVGEFEDDDDYRPDHD